MISRWLRRGGLGQILAPDPNIREEDEIAERNEFTGGLWNILAPDPNFAPTTTTASPPPAKNEEEQERPQHVVPSSSADTPSVAFSTPVKSSSNEVGRKDSQKDEGESQSEFPSTTGTLDPTSSTGRVSFLSPSSSHLRPEPKVKGLVLSAAKDLTDSMFSPRHVWEDNKNFMSYCASTTQLNEKKLKKVKRMLQKDPSLANARASNMGNIVQDGFTPLHAAAFVGNYDVALILIDFTVEEKCHEDDGFIHDIDDEEEDKGQATSPEVVVKLVHPVDLDARDVQGRTALHIASSQGHVKVVQLLKEKMKERLGVEPMGEHAPTDLTGRTPLGWAAMSRENKARENIVQLRNELFSPGDKSVYGEKTPAFMRMGSVHGRNMVHDNPRGFDDLMYGFADMPGHRIEMEDAICHAFPLVPPSKCDSIGFFGVFDGHGDGGVSSKFVGENIIPYFTSSKEWTEFHGDVNVLAEGLKHACSTADVELKKELSKGNSVRRGGSTGVMAIVGSEYIVVGNVGDSRCILVQTANKNEEEQQNPCINVDGAQESTLAKDFQDLSLGGGGGGGGKNETNAGDDNKSTSKIVVKALSTDHKPNLQEEKNRIEKAGMVVAEETFTIDGVTSTISKICKSASDRIAVSRAFGDFDYKENMEVGELEQAIIAVPEITIHHRDHSRDMYLVLACDGVYDVMSNDMVGEFVVNKVNELSYRKDDTSPILPEVGDELLKECLNLGSSDNMSVLIVSLAKKCGGHDKDSATRTLNFADV